jgi:multidrug resistance efflux pump
MSQVGNANVAESPPSTTDGAQRLDPQEVAFLALHSERELIERELTLAQQQQRFGTSDAEIEQARSREDSLLKDLDRVMTLIRAAEYKRQPGARRW